VLPPHPCAGSSDLSLRLWDVHTHTAIASLTGSTSPVTSLHFSPSSAVVAAACSDGSVRLWSTSSGAAVAALAGHAAAAACCTVWSSDEALVAAAAGDGSVGVWEVATGLRRVALARRAAARRCCRRPRVMRARVRSAVVVAAGVAGSERQRGAAAVECRRAGAARRPRRRVQLAVKRAPLPPQLTLPPHPAVTDRHPRLAVPLLVALL
jgi:hypothetical protein